jgi:hypothetical protein
MNTDYMKLTMEKKSEFILSPFVERIRLRMTLIIKEVVSPANMTTNLAPVRTTNGNPLGKPPRKRRLP